MTRIRIRRKARLARQAGSCGAALAAALAPSDQDLDGAFLRARFALAGLTASLGYPLAEVRAELEHPTPTDPAAA